MTPVVIRLAQQPPIRRAAHHAWTACLSAALTICALATGLASAATLAFLINPLTAGPTWQLMFAAILATAAYRLTHYTAALVHIIRGRI